MTWSMLTAPSRIVALLALALTGCATVDPYASPPMSQHLQREDDIGYCARLFAEIDHRIDLLGVRDAEAHRIVGFPYLRVDRFSAALSPRAATAEQQRAWRARLQRLDETARTSELANAALSIDDVPRCRELLDAADSAATKQLRDAATVPDDYSTALRVLGLYPLTRLPFAAGIARWHADTRAVFVAPIDSLPVRGRLFRYGPEPPSRTSTDSLSVDALSVPVPSATEQAALLNRHAPVLEIDVADTFDHVGALKLDGEDRVTIDTAGPVAYTRIAYTLLGGVIYPQLVYTFWFSERPHSPGSAFDLLAGKLDGVVWRVTVDSTGEALVYDSIHACGCYHLFFPTDKVAARALPDTLDESLFAPQTLAKVRSGERVVLRIESRTHYLQRVLTEKDSTTNAMYRMQDERTLTRLVRPSGGTRSAYGEDGLIAGSERGERWFFWPMGIESAGQMRQWGRHATAFVGRRHFDDPLLFDAYFELRR